MVTASDCVGFTLPGIIEDPGSFAGKLNSPYPALGPEPRNLISLAILSKQTAVVLSVPEKFTIESCAARAANLYFDGLKFI